MSAKLCMIEGCNRQINQWATYCNQHYNQVMQMKERQGQAMPMQNQGQEQQPHVPTNVDLLNSYPAMPEMPNAQVDVMNDSDAGRMENNYNVEPEQEPEPIDDINEIVEDDVIVQEPPRIPRQNVPIQNQSQQQDPRYANPHFQSMQGQQQPFQYQEQQMPQQQQQQRQQGQPQRQARQMPPARFDMPNISDEQRLDIKKVAFSGALNFLITQDAGEKTYMDMIEEVRTLTSAFYRVIVEKNEK